MSPRPSDVLAEIVGGAHRTLTVGVYTKRARDGGT